MKQPWCFLTETPQVKADEPKTSIPPTNVSMTMAKPYSAKLHATEDIESLYPKLSRNSRAQTADTVGGVFYERVKQLNVIFLGCISSLISCILVHICFLGDISLLTWAAFVCFCKSLTVEGFSKTLFSQLYLDSKNLG